MGSTMTNMEQSTVTTDSGVVKNIPQFMQFVPGRVEVAVLSQNDFFAKSGDGNAYLENVNSIIAFPYYHNIKRRADLYKDSNWDEYRYFPLLRGMYEMPASGDPVLLCTIGGQNFFLGPLNTENHVNWNKDLLLSKMYPPVYSKNKGNWGNFNGPLPDVDNKSFVKEKQRNKLQKQTDVTETNEFFRNLDNPKSNPNIKHGHGDVMLEGRHGNAIRIGSRYKDPYVIISNGLQPGHTQETLGIASTIAMLHKGTSWQHFGHYKAEDGDVGVYDAVGLYLGSERFNDTTRKIEYSLHLTENLSEDFNPFNHMIQYDSPQTIIDSHRITLNSKMEDIYLSSKKNIHLGARKDITITSTDSLIFNTKYTYLGAPAKLHHYNNELDDGDEAKDDNLPLPEPMVLGQELVNILNELIDTLQTACYITPAGAPMPLVDNMFKPISIEDNPGLQVSGSEQLVKDAGGTPLSRKSLFSIKRKLEGIKSEYHFIENNDEDKNPQQGESPSEQQTGGSAE